MNHHAYVCEGPQKLLGELAQNARKLFNFDTGHNPDVQVMVYEKFGIDDSEALKTAVSFKTISGRALYIIGIGSITTEAQQALLKLFEEPQQGVIFVLLVPHGSLIATLRSRMLPYPQAIEFKQNLSAVKKFLQVSPKLRSIAIAALLKDEEGVRERVREFVDSLERELYTQLEKSKGKRGLREGLEDIAKVRSYLGDRSQSLKMLLEHLALSLPTV